MPTALQLDTPRLTLRPWQPSDRAPFALMNADPDVMTFFAAPLSPAESDDAIDRYLAQLDRDGFTMFAVELRHDHSFAGTIGLQTMRTAIPNLPQPAVEIGWRLTRSAQGQGLATEGARALCTLAFRDFHLPQLVAITTPANIASRRVMEKLGMSHRPELTYEHPSVPPGHPFRQHVVYSLDNPTPKDLS